MKYFILTLGLFLTTNIGFAQETKRLTAEKHNEYGLIYSLPQTHLDIEVVATKTTRKAGPYYQYAEKYLGIPGAITQDSEEWALSSVKVTPYGVPDPEEQYLMQFKPGDIRFSVHSVPSFLKSAGGHFLPGAYPPGAVGMPAIRLLFFRHSENRLFRM